LLLFLVRLHRRNFVRQLPTLRIHLNAMRMTTCIFWRA
jgi:hypothetical protein